MQSILCLDFSSEIGEVILATVNGTTVNVQEQRSLPFGRKDILAETPSADETGSLETSDETEVVDPLSKQLREELDKLAYGWSNCVLVLPDDRFLGLNLELPFSDTKSVERVIDLEVQDVVPFDIADFLLQHQMLGGKVGPLHEIFVGLLPRASVGRALSIVQDAGLEPHLVTTPASAVSAVLHLAPEYFKRSCMIISAHDPYYSLAVCIDGNLKAERYTLRDIHDDEENSFKSLFLTLRLSVASLERRYNQKLEVIYVFGSLQKLSLLQQALGRPVEAFTLKDVATLSESMHPLSSSFTGLAALASFFAQDEAPRQALSNFRVREFSYSPRFEELQRGLRSLKNHALAAFLSLLFVIGAVYFARERYVSSQNEALVEQVKKVIPNFNGNSANILADLREQETKLSDELGILGSPSRITPLDILANIARDLPEMAGLQITMLKVSGGRATLDGVAPDLSAVDKIQKALRQNKKAYSKVSAQTGAASASTKGYRFSLELVLNQ